MTEKTNLADKVQAAVFGRRFAIPLPRDSLLAGPRSAPMLDLFHTLRDLHS